MWTFHLSLTGYVLVLETECWWPRKPIHPLETTLREIEQAIKAELYYAAIMMTLALPGICAALENEELYSGRDEYKKWYREHLATTFPYMSDEVAYSLRCGVVHLGNLRIKAKGASETRAIFTLPNAQRATIHNSSMRGTTEGDMVQFDAATFCYDTISVVRTWCEQKVDDPVIQANLPSLLQVRPNGFGPILGLPVIT
jgi:hypothetical protein